MRRTLRLVSGTGRVKFHLRAKTQRTHIGPNLIDVLKALGLSALLSHRAPTGWRLGVSEPDGVLLLMVDHHLVRAVILFFFGHNSSSFWHHRLDASAMSGDRRRVSV